MKSTVGTASLCLADHGPDHDRSHKSVDCMEDTVVLTVSKPTCLLDADPL